MIDTTIVSAGVLMRDPLNEPKTTVQSFRCDGHTPSLKGSCYIIPMLSYPQSLFSKVLYHVERETAGGQNWRISVFYIICQQCIIIYAHNAIPDAAKRVHNVQSLLPGPSYHFAFTDIRDACLPKTTSQREATASPYRRP